MYLDDPKLKKHNLIYFINHKWLICTIEMLRKKRICPFNSFNNNVCCFSFDYIDTYFVKRNTWLFVLEKNSFKNYIKAITLEQTSPCAKFFSMIQLIICLGKWWIAVSARNKNRTFCLRSLMLQRNWIK